MGENGLYEATSPTDRFRGFGIVEFEGRVYGIPPRVARVDPTNPEQLRHHPAVVSAPTKELLEARIAAFDPTPFECHPVGEFEDYTLLRHGGRVYGVPRDYGPVDLNWEEDRTRDGVVCGNSREEVEARIRANREASAVEFLGWLPTFKWFGNCGAHPQFGHIELPPTGYKFVRSRPRTPVPTVPGRPKPPGIVTRIVRLLTAPFRSARGIARNVREFGAVQCLLTITACLRLFLYLLRKTGKAVPALRFVHSRHFRSQVMAPRRAELAFLTSIPQTYGQHPWVIEIEDSTTLFFPFLMNGQTAELDVLGSPYYAMAKALLESDGCRGILTHMRSTAESLPTLFQSDIIARKASYAPLGVRLPERWQTQDDDDTINLLFTNSWHQQGVGFYLRGGLDVLEAFDILHERYPQLRLTLRSQLPRLDPRYQRIIEKCWVRVIDRFMPRAELDELQRESHIYLIPSARIHIVSVLQAMSFGQVVVAADGWGVDEYLEHERTGLVVPGRGGKVSWMERDTGILREDYRPMYTPDPAVVEGLVAAVSRLVEDREFRKKLGRAARKAVETRYTLDRWNAALKAVFDKARAAG